MAALEVETPTFGAQLRQYRRQHRLLQRELAEVAAVSESLIGQLETGVLAHPHRNTVQALAIALGLRGLERAAFIRAAGYDPLQIDNPSPLGQLLQGYRLRAEVSQNELGRRAGLSASVVNRLETGERDATTRETATALARGLDLSDADADRLLFAAGFVPVALQWLGWEHPTLRAVLSVLTNDDLTEREREEFAVVIRTLAARWQGGRAS